MKVELSKVEQEFVRRVVSARMNTVEAAFARQDKELQFVLDAHEVPNEHRVDVMMDPDETIWLDVVEEVSQP